MGDTFSQVRAAYPDAEFSAGQEGVASGNYDLFIQDEQQDRRMAFWFRDHATSRMIRKGQKIEVEDEIVQQMKLWIIYVMEPYYGD